MRIFRLCGTARFSVLSGILLLSLVCRAERPDDTQSCTGSPEPAAVRRAQPASANKISPVAATATKAPTIRLSWTESVSPASTVQGYYIYRRQTGEPCQVHPEECMLLNPERPIKGKGCTDYSVVVGHTYTYQAQTLGKNSLTSTFSSDATATAR